MKTFARGAVIAALTLAACAPQQQQPTVAPAPASMPQPTPVATPSGPSAADILNAQSDAVQSAIRSHDAGGSWPTIRTGATVIYPYDPDTEPVIGCAPLRTTDVQLAAGETITDLALGDSERWSATPASSGDPMRPTPHIALKPQVQGIETNATIYTTRRIYHLRAEANGHAMREVEFYYPEEVLAEMRAASEHTAEPVAAATPAPVNYSYQVTGPNVRWKPTRVYDDGAHVYVEMPDAMKASEAPALMIEANGGTQMLNYRLVDGKTFVADRLFDKAELVAGVGRDQDKVTIAYTGGTR